MVAVEKILAKYWGHSQFRPLQKEIITAVLDKKNTLALLPTGGGKSICFQVPTLANEGLCLVISPLIALMKDQVERLHQMNISAAFLHSNLTSEEQIKVLDKCAFSDMKFLYISPERLSSDNFLARINDLKISLLAIDEAHCISQWGYDFRPAYLKIKTIFEYLPTLTTIALTASATPDVLLDIAEQLAMKEPMTFRASFLRPNLSFVIRKTEDKKTEIVHILSKIKGTAIVYVRTRKLTVDVSLWLQRAGLKADFYHAGLSFDQRSAKQNEWISNRTRVMVCTNAFGMGIDKADVRLVIHHQPSETLEAYYQEAGRAGRDGQKAFAVMLMGKEDEALFSDEKLFSIPTSKEIKHIYNQLLAYCQIPYHQGISTRMMIDLGQFCKQENIAPQKALYAFTILEYHEYLQYSDSANERPKIQLAVGNQELYRFMTEHKKSEPLLKLLLRTSPGIFEMPITIREDTISHKLKMNISSLQNQLSFLEQMGIIYYTKSNTNPTITLLKDREKIEEMYLDADFLKKRFDSYKKRLQAVRFYLSQDQICRAAVIAAYFGEKDSEDCGVCDICLKKKPKKEFEPAEYFEKLIYILATPKNIQEVSELLTLNIKQTNHLVQWAQATHQITLNENGEYLKK